MKFESDPTFVALMNFITNAKNAGPRILLMGQLVRPFAKLFVAPPETLEQLLAKLEQELKEDKHVLPPETYRVAYQHIAYLKVFLKHRAAMIETLREFCIDFGDTQTPP